MTRFDTKVACAGCGAMISDDYTSRIQITLAPGKTVPVCRTGRSSRRGPKASCERKAREDSAGTCRGCGRMIRAHEDGLFDPLCEGCDEVLARERKRLSNSEQKLYCILRGPFLWASACDKIESAFATMLDPVGGSAWASCDSAEALNPEDRDSYTTNGMVLRLTPRQAEATRTFLQLHRSAMQKALAEARQRGQSILVGLAAGSVSVEDYNREQTRLAQERQKP